MAIKISDFPHGTLIDVSRSTSPITVNNWCAENFGQYGVRWYSIGSREQYLYRFKHEDDFVYFKLAWK